MKKPEDDCTDYSSFIVSRLHKKENWGNLYWQSSHKNPGRFWIHTHVALLFTYIQCIILFYICACIIRTMRQQELSVGGKGKRGKDAHGGVQTYTIGHYNDLGQLLGNQWHTRVLNVIGDFSYAILGTVSFHLNRDRPLSEYKVVRNEDGTYKFEVFLELFRFQFC